MRTPAVLLVFWLLAVPAATVHPHPGGMDASGCHTDRKHGGYHCHKGPLAGQAFASKAEAQRALGGSGSGQPPATQSVPRVPASSAPPEESAGTVRYDRELYGGWTDADGDCQDTRQEVLIAESVVPVQLDAAGCRVVSGRWMDPYSGREITNPSELDIDHLVPLAESHRSGGDAWTPERRRAYANHLAHPEHLIAVSAGANRSKGDKDPASWLPENAAYRCEYVRIWVLVKLRWGLRADDAELAAVDTLMRACAKN
jgi:hypothetical protein